MQERTQLTFNIDVEVDVMLSTHGSHVAEEVVQSEAVLEDGFERQLEQLTSGHFLVVQAHGQS